MLYGGLFLCVRVVARVCCLCLLMVLACNSFVFDWLVMRVSLVCVCFVVAFWALGFGWCLYLVVAVGCC